ncbi:MAG TPA: lamin tail domain-containing protein, partial [Gemmataceae bacterium]|nr:lamin tail domain-containing protein [Gemmataceae bacterium]
IYYSGNRDAPLSNFLSNQSPNNFFAVRNRTGNQGFQFFAHDSEHTFLNVGEDRTGPAPGQPVGPNNGWPLTTTSLSKSNPQWMFQLLLSNPEFKQLVADRAQKLFFDNGPLTPGPVAARMGVRRDQINRAIYGESARWGDSKHSPAYTHDTWQTEINRVFNSYIPQRTDAVLGQLRNRGWISTVVGPTYSQNGGNVPAGYPLTISNPNGVGTIYYTLDGSDPRLLGGGVSGAAQVYNGTPITISQTREVKARVFNNGTWSPLEDAVFTLNSAGLRITEVMYNPTLPAGSNLKTDDYEYLELYNSGATDIDLSGMQFIKGVTMTFAQGTTLLAGQRAVVVKNPTGFQARYGTGIPILGTYTDKLSDGGEEVELVGAGGSVIADFTYADSWYDNTDGGGYSLVVRNPTADPTTLNDPNAWRPSNDLNGKPGAADPGYDPDSVVINEVLTNPENTGGDWVELYNTTNSAIDLNGWFLSDSPADLRKYQIRTGPGVSSTVIPAHGYLTFFANTTFNAPGNPGVNTPFGLKAAGDSVRLTSVDTAGNAGGYQEHESFDAAEPGVTFGRFTNTAGKTHFTALLVPTPGGANSGPRVGSVVINELMYFPTTGQEFIELRNLTGQAVPLYDPANPQNTWRFTDGINFTFPAGAAIPAWGYALVVGGDPTQFRSQNPSVPAAVPVFGPYTAADGSNVLSNGGERVTVSKPLPPDPTTGVVPLEVVDSVSYDVVAPWPTAPDGFGPSLSKTTGSNYGDDPSTWQAGPNSGTPGRQNLPNTPPTVAAFPGATINEAGQYTANGTFSDPDPDPADSWTATVDYGDGTGPQPLTLT